MRRTIKICLRFYHFISHVFRQTHSPEPHSRWWPSQMRYYYYLSFVFHWTTTGNTKTEAAHTNSANTRTWTHRNISGPVECLSCLVSAALSFTYISNSAHRFLLVHLFFPRPQWKSENHKLLFIWRFTARHMFIYVERLYIVSLTQKSN